MRTLVNVNPAAEIRAFEEMFERLFATPRVPNPATHALPIDVLERENKLVVRASVPGIDPNALEVQVEANVLTISGVTASDSETSNEKVYRREITTGRFSRSLRLPEGLDLDKIEAEFRHGVVTITLPRQEEEKPKSIRIAIRNGDTTEDQPEA